MSMRRLGLGLTVLFVGCVRPALPSPLPRKEDSSIVIPHFFERPEIEVGAPGEQFVLDGAVLRALRIAADDFLPPQREQRACWNRQEAHRYQVIRQGPVIFVRIDEALESCGLQYVSLDTGVTYAISEEGRILRRVSDAQVARPAQAASESTVLADAGTPLPEAPGSDGGTEP